MLEQRRLQQLGRSTLMVSVPKQWVDKLNLKKGTVVNLTTDEYGRLIVHPSLDLISSKTTCVIHAGTDEKFLRRLVLGAYLAGHETVEVTAKVPLTAGQLETIRETLNKLIGVSIVEQKEGRVVVQNFLDPTKFPIEGLTSRLHLIVESMLDLAVRGLVEENASLALEAIGMDVEADKVYFLATRLILQAVGDKGLAEKVGLANPKNILGYRLILKALEEIGDLAQDIAKSVIRVNDFGYSNKKVNELIAELRGQCRKTAIRAMESLTRRDPRSANSAIAEYERLAQLEGSLGSAAEAGLAIAPRVAEEIKSLRRDLLQVGRYYMIAAEVAMNRAVEEGSTAVTEVVSAVVPKSA
jgi:phosphate uptake regulator